MGREEKDMSMQTPLAKIRGLGSAHSGVHHWWLQRMTAIANIPLMLWFVFSIASHAGAGYAEVQAWMSSPFVAVATLLLIYATFYHATLGLQVVIEDYVHEKGVKFAALIGMKYAFIVLGVASAFAVLKVAFGG